MSMPSAFAMRNTLPGMALTAFLTPAFFTWARTEKYAPSMRYLVTNNARHLIGCLQTWRG